MEIQCFVFFLHLSLDLILRFVYIADAVPICIISLMFLKRPITSATPFTTVYKLYVLNCPSCAICDCAIVVFSFFLMISNFSLN